MLEHMKVDFDLDGRWQSLLVEMGRLGCESILNTFATHSEIFPPTFLGAVWGPLGQTLGRHHIFYMSDILDNPRMLGAASYLFLCVAPPAHHTRHYHHSATP